MSTAALQNQNAQIEGLEQGPNILIEAHEAVTSPAERVADNLETGMGQRLMDRVQDFGANVVDFASKHKPARRGAGAATLAATAALLTPAAANAGESPPIKQTITSTEITATFKSEFKTTSEKTSDVASGKVKFLQNVSDKPIPRKIVKRLRKQGKCGVFNGKEVSIETYGLGGGRGTYGRDYRTSEFCRWKNGMWYRVLCKNPARIKLRQRSPKPNPNSRVVFLRRNLAKVPLKLTAVSRAQSFCVTKDGLTYAAATGSGRATISASMSSYVKTKGRSAYRSSVSGMAEGEARADSSAKATCASTDTEVTINTTTTNPWSPPNKPNNPPTGEMKPPQHLYPYGKGRINVDNIYDQDGDDVKAGNFKVYMAGDPQKRAVGTISANVTPSSGRTQGVDYEAPANDSTNDVATSEAELNDGRGGLALVQKNFNLYADDFGN